MYRVYVYFSKSNLTQSSSAVEGWVSDPDPVFLPGSRSNFSGSGIGFQIFLDPDPVNIRPDPKPWARVK